MKFSATGVTVVIDRTLPTLNPEKVIGYSLRENRMKLYRVAIFENDTVTFTGSERISALSQYSTEGRECVQAAGSRVP